MPSGFEPIIFRYLSQRIRPMNKILDHIKELEEKLLHTDFRKNPESINELLSEDFEEIGSIGRISSRKEVIHWLVTKDQDASWALNDFRVRKLATDLILATYRAKKMGSQSDNSKGSIRSSIWKLCANNWKMIFHQGTKIVGE